MKGKRMAMGFLTALLAGGFLCQCPDIAEAAMVRGSAAIVNGDMAKARREAREDAMRSCIEQEVGTHVTSSTETSMGMVVSDRIMAEADGYVTVKGTPREWQEGGLFFVELDLTASAQKIGVAVEDVKAQLQNALNADTTGRSHVVVAVSGRNAEGKLENNNMTNIISTYVAQTLSTQGFTTHDTDAVAAYIARQDFDDPIARANARKEVRNEMPDVNAILRGSLSTVKVEHIGGNWVATVGAAFQLVGIVSSETNSFSEYFTAVDTSREMAIKKAQERATQKAISHIGARAAETMQGETRGGVQHLKIAVHISGVMDRTGQGKAILAGLQSAGCRVIRSLYDKNDPTTLKVFVDASSVGSLQELTDKIQAQLPMLEEGDNDTDAAGAQKLYFRLRR
ncbi:hypothetical protein [Selenomonas ruminantium]|uniref:Flagellar assembly protein T N-terminal domain-containing protein n=1 Tax=Selenomonas ruminantium TaxID=971 RepID=A0A1K1NKE1_SELRU|nr:hypothetical protein [Selenomonas ruminantium]SFW35741.1 hypothetical protein SAMN02910323_1434 [Selenomonas ruminantium]